MPKDYLVDYGNIGWNPPGRLRLNDQDQYLEQVWDGILSREEGSIRRTYLSLDKISREVVAEHLQRMSQEDGWHPEQVTSARRAIEVISTIKVNENGYS